MTKFPFSVSLLLASLLGCLFFLPPVQSSLAQDSVSSISLMRFDVAQSSLWYSDHGQTYTVLPSWSPRLQFPHPQWGLAARIGASFIKVEGATQLTQREVLAPSFKLSSSSSWELELPLGAQSWKGFHGYYFNYGLGASYLFAREWKHLALEGLRVSFTTGKYHGIRVHDAEVGLVFRGI